MSDRVLLVSPVRNEAAHIERIVAAVAGQTRPPDAWIVVDDGSTDGTSEILRMLEDRVSFMRVLQAPEGYTTAGVDRLAAAAAPRAFNLGLRSVSWNEFTHVGKLDGDTELPADYLERLLEEFRRDSSLGIGGGIRVEQFADGWRELHVPRHHVPGALKLYTTGCFEAIGGMHERLGWDTIDETYARMHGFTTRSFPALVTRHHRHWGTADGRLRGRARHGQAAYILHYDALFVLARSLKVATAAPWFLSGLAFIYGYVHAAIVRTPRVEDPDFRRFMRRELRARVLPPLCGRTHVSRI